MKFLLFIILIYLTISAILVTITAFINYKNFKICTKFKIFLKTIFFSSSCILTAFIFRILKKLIKYPTPVNNTEPILFIHGLYHDDTAWFFCSKFLRKQHLKNQFFITYSSFNTDIESLTLIIEARINEIHQLTDKKITIVAHSLGGLLATNAITKEDIAKKVKTLITLGTPFKGSSIAKIASTSLGRSLHPKNPFFQKDLSCPDGKINKTAILSAFDEMVSPWENLIPTDKNWQVMNSNVLGHAHLLYSKEIYLKLYSIINRTS